MQPAHSAVRLARSAEAVATHRPVIMVHAALPLPPPVRPQEAVRRGCSCQERPAAGVQLHACTWRRVCTRAVWLPPNAAACPQVFVRVKPLRSDVDRCVALEHEAIVKATW